MIEDPKYRVSEDFEMQKLLQQRQGQSGNLKRRRKPSEEAENDWLITYADAVTMLLAFFVLIFSVSEIRQAKFEELQEQLGETLLRKESVKNPLKELQSSLNGVLNRHDIDPLEAVSVTDRELKIDLPGELLFETASTDLEGDSVDLIRELAARIKAFPLKNYTVVIEGHTDDVPISNPRFPSNWQLSSGRAISVLQIFFDAGINKDRLMAVGYADTRPKVPNRDAAGEPIPKNRAQNRRVEIKVSRI